ncbi:MAG: hypothetical protein KAT65_21805 [Methanophagales archaeon]|nr:hypothetical protein [Methanophagales archaeon]
MLRKASASSIATISFVTLLLILLFYPLVREFSEYNVFFIVFGQFVAGIVGGTLVISFVIVVVALMVSIVTHAVN